MKHAVCYVKSTTDYNILLSGGNGTIEHDVHSNSNWAHDHSKQRLRTKFINSGPVVCCLRVQSSTAQCTAKADYTALSSSTRKILWVYAILEKVTTPVCSHSTLYQGNLNTTTWTENVQELRKTKHIGIKYHYF